MHRIFWNKYPLPQLSPATLTSTCNLHPKVCRKKTPLRPERVRRNGAVWRRDTSGLPRQPWKWLLWITCIYSFAENLNSFVFAKMHKASMLWGIKFQCGNETRYTWSWCQVVLVIYILCVVGQKGRAVCEDGCDLQIWLWTERCSAAVELWAATCWILSLVDS